MSVLVVIDLRANPEMTEQVRFRLQQGLRDIRTFEGVRTRRATLISMTFETSC